MLTQERIVLTDTDIEYIQSFRRTTMELEYARGENKLCLLAFYYECKEYLQKRGLLDRI
jgi:hypothetical protein